MAFLFEHINSVDVSKLRASEVSQCLLYLEYISKFDPTIWEKGTSVRKKLNDRLAELREEKKT